MYIYIFIYTFVYIYIYTYKSKKNLNSLDQLCASKLGRQAVSKSSKDFKCPRRFCNRWLLRDRFQKPQSLEPTGLKKKAAWIADVEKSGRIKSWLVKICKDC